MHKRLTLIITFFLVSSIQAQTSGDLKANYAQFRKSYLALISSSPKKTNFVKYFNDSEAELNRQYEAFSKKEKKLSPEGNQMALDIEMLEPLEMLLNGQLDCEKAHHDNEMNAAADKTAAAKIKVLIDKICKK